MIPIEDCMALNRFCGVFEVYAVVVIFGTWKQNTGVSIQALLNCIVHIWSLRYCFFPLARDVRESD